MNASMYARYPARSLVRGGQRSVLALFCVAVGVMAIIGLRLVGAMVEDALVGNARVLNGGDVSARVITTPLAGDDLAVFEELRRRGIITAYTAVVQEDGQVTRQNGKRASIQVRAVEPAAFPLVGEPALHRALSAGAGGGFRAVLGTPGDAIVTPALLDQLGGELGKTVTVTANAAGGARQFDVRLAGVLTEGAALAGQGEALFTSVDTYRRASDLPFGYGAVYATTPDDARAAEAEGQINERLPLARTQTAAELLEQLEDQVVLIKRFLVIVGLLALLIVGAGAPASRRGDAELERW